MFMFMFVVGDDIHGGEERAPPQLLYKPLFKTSLRRRYDNNFSRVSPRILEFSLVKPVFLCF